VPGAAYHEQPLEWQLGFFGTAPDPATGWQSVAEARRASGNATAFDAQLAARMRLPPPADTATGQRRLYMYCI
jgi:hypothetical protein